MTLKMILINLIKWTLILTLKSVFWFWVLNLAIIIKAILMANTKQDIILFVPATLWCFDGEWYMIVLVVFHIGWLVLCTYQILLKGFIINHMRNFVIICLLKVIGLILWLYLFELIYELIIKNSHAPIMLLVNSTFVKFDW